MSEIQPALSAEQWRKHYPPTVSFDIPDHAMAAVLLRGYFTWDMVDGLRQMAKEGRDAYRVGDNSAYPAMDPEDIDAIADRIEALLPPRE